jgi:hypothetical protein
MIDNKKEITDPEVRDKKTYSKPAINRVQLVAEEAVLAVCKNGNPDTCEAAAMTCLNIAGS